MTTRPTEELTVEELIVGDLTFEIRRSARRRSIELIVDRGGELIIVAPPGLDDAVMEEYVREKRFWLYTKIAEKEARRRETSAKEFISGEGFPYLGRSYRLLVVDEQPRPLKLVAGRFCLRRSNLPDARQLFIDWYSRHADKWLRRRVKEWAGRMGVEVTRIHVQDLGFRWGSCSASGTLNFHWATILLPASIVDYIIAHELAHLIEPNHTPEFWSVVEGVMFDWAERKRWLAEYGQGFLL